MNEIERSWQKQWPSFVPEKIVVEKPLTEYFRDISGNEPDRCALDFYGQEITYKNLNHMIDRLAWGLVGLGMQKGARVALLLQNCPQFVIGFFGILRAGGVVVSMNPMFKHPEIEYELKDAEAEILICLDYLYLEVEKIRDRVPLRHVILTSLHEFLPEEPVLPLPPEGKEESRSFPGTLSFEKLLAESEEKPICKTSNLSDELALLQYTGGTTGLPKGAMITHHALTGACLGSKYWFNNTDDDVFLGVTPFFHIMGMVQMMCAPLISGGKVVVLSRFIPDVVLKAIDHYRCSAWVGATTMLVALLQVPDLKQYDLSCFRYICSGGSPVTPQIQNEVNKLAPDAVIVDGYGLTESVSQGGAITPLGGFKPGFVGVPHVNDMKVVDLESGKKELPPNEEGEITIRGPALTKGYWNKPEETDGAFEEGWFYTGDIGSMDEEGYLKFIGRKKELIKCSGYSVFPAEVEELLCRHPAVAEVAVIGVPDSYRGESPKAFVVLRPEHEAEVTEETLIAWCKQNMAAYKRPREIEFRNDLPKSAAGKILRRLLVEKE